MIFGTEPFCSPISEYDNERWGDFFRFTEKGIRSLFIRLQNGTLQTSSLGNWTTSYALYKGFCIEDNLVFDKKPDSMYATNIGYTYQNGN
jgi:hypothetical protein